MHRPGKPLSDPRPTLSAVFLAFLRLGLTAFGGPAMDRKFAYQPLARQDRNQPGRTTLYSHGLGCGLSIQRSDIMMPRTLFTKLALALTLLLLGIGLLYTLLSTSLANHYQQVFLQNLNRDLAQNIIAKRQLINDGALDNAAS